MKKQFDWDKFRNEKIAVHCKTEEEAKDFCQKMHEHGMKWYDRSTYLERTNYSDFKEKTCYSGIGCYCDYEYYNTEKYEILEWRDFMQKEFTKADLKDWMIVKCRNGEMLLRFGEKLINNDGFEELSTFDNNLKDVGFSSDYDIMKIYKLNLTKVYCLEDIFNIENLELIWERTEIKHMTVEEMQKKLEELTGEKIEIEPSREEMLGVCYKICKSYTDSLFCKGCTLCEIDDCEFVNLSDEELKQCYEKVIADGK